MIVEGKFSSKKNFHWFTDILNKWSHKKYHHAPKKKTAKKQHWYLKQKISVFNKHTQQPSSSNYAELPNISDKGRPQTHFFPSGNGRKCIIVYNTRAVLSAQSTYYVLWSFIIINFLTSINKFIEVRFKEHWTSLVTLQFCRLFVSDPLWPHGLQHPRPFCPSSTARACSNSCASSWWCHPTILSSCIPFSSWLQSSPASGFFSSESVLHIRWPKNWSFSFSISPFKEYSGLISFRIDWFDLLAIQWTLKSLQHHSSKVSM